MIKIFIFLATIVPRIAFSAFGLNPIPNDFTPQKNSEAIVTNMPKVRSQDSIGICYAFVASTLIDEANCTRDNISACSARADEQRTSPLDMTRFNSKLADDLDNTDRFSYEGLNMDGGNQAWTLFQAMRADSITKESCAPFDQVISRLSDPGKAQEAELATWKKFEDAYSNYKKKSANCVDCGLEYATAVSKNLKEEYNLKATNKDILEAFSQDSYSKFLDKLLIPDACWDLKNQTRLKGNWDLKSFPTSKDKKKDYDSFIGKIKEVLGKKRPLSFSFCTQTPLIAKNNKSCGQTKEGKLQGEGHAVVIKGYRKVCNSQNICRDSVQVHNSWGESWQNANNDGWVDAKELLGRSFYEDLSMSWLESTSTN